MEPIGLMESEVVEVERGNAAGDRRTERRGGGLEVREASSEIA